MQSPLLNHPAVAPRPEFHAPTVLVLGAALLGSALYFLLGRPYMYFHKWHGGLGRVGGGMYQLVYIYSDIIDLVCVCGAWLYWALKEWCSWLLLACGLRVGGAATFF
jgi:hypothetical protein